MDDVLTENQELQVREIARQEAREEVRSAPPEVTIGHMTAFREIAREEAEKALAEQAASALGDPDVKDKSAAGQRLALRRWRRRK